MAKRLVFLQLAPEFGSTRFGPFPGAEIRLGSDPERNDIVLPEALGVAPEHVRLLKQQDEGFVVAPVQRTDAVYLWRADGRPPKLITSPVALAAGDGFSLVSAEGPRFIILLEHPRQQEDDGSKDSFNRAKDRLSGGSMWKEIKRQGLTRVLTTGIGQMLQSAWTFIISGAVFQPRYIILGMTIAFGWVMAGGAGCAVIGMKWQNDAVSADLASTQDRLAACEGADQGSEEINLMSVTQLLLGSVWSNTLRNDDVLAGLYQQRVAAIYASPERYNWVYRRQRENPYVQFRAHLEQTRLDASHVRVLAYLAATPGADAHREWELITDVNDNDVCGRGPLRMTYQQARTLQLTPLSPDVLVPASVARNQDVERIRQAMQEIIEDVDSLGDFNTTAGDVGANRYCVFVDEIDDVRNDTQRLAVSLSQQLLPGARDLPGPDQANSGVMRLFKVFAADLEHGFERVNFTQSGQSSFALETITSENRRNQILRHTAEVIARAAVLPCLARRDRSQPTPEWAEQDVGSPVQCALLQYFAGEER